MIVLTTIKFIFMMFVAHHISRDSHSASIARIIPLLPESQQVTTRPAWKRRSRALCSEPQPQLSWLIWLAS